MGEEEEGIIIKDYIEMLQKGFDNMCFEDLDKSYLFIYKVCGYIFNLFCCY